MKGNSKVKFQISTFVMNLPERKDRYNHVMNEFRGKEEFNLKIVTSIKNKKGAIGLWMTIRYILQNLVTDEPYVLICEDDIKFTENYNKELLQLNILQAIDLEADILLGGVSWYTGVIPICENLMWTHYFNGTQFFIIFRKFYDKILNTNYYTNDVADIKLSSISSNKFCIHPFIAIQKDFGYSDATENSLVINKIEEIFAESEARMNMVRIICDYYNYNA